MALASLGAGTIHLALGPEHMATWSVLGYGFFASGVLQLFLGVSLFRTESRRPLALASASSLALIGVWLVSRTTGLPVGPQAGRAEAFGRADVLCIALEAVVGLGALALLLRPHAGRSPADPTPARRLTLRAVVAGAALSVLATTGVAVAAPGHEHSASPEHSDCPTSPVRSGVDDNHNGADDAIERYFACQLHEAHQGHDAP